LTRVGIVPEIDGKKQPTIGMRCPGHFEKETDI
jgi:hypothetical protein